MENKYKNDDDFYEQEGQKLLENTKYQMPNIIWQHPTSSGKVYVGNIYQA